MRHADAGYEIAIDCAREQGLNLPMIGPVTEVREVRAGAADAADLRRIYEQPAALRLSTHDRARIAAASALVDKIVAAGDAAYGINTGFGLLAQTRIPAEQLALLQRNLLLSHAAGVGDPLPDAVVRLILALKINALARGHSGITMTVIDALLALLRHEVYPVIPAQGSVGASGDLAPLAHLSTILLGIGEVRIRGAVVPAAEGLRAAGLAPLELRAKEGLALINGTQVSTALALAGLFGAEDVFAAAVVAGAMSVDALKGSDSPFDARIQQVRGQPGQIAVAREYRDLIAGSAIRASHLDCTRVQDPYSFRCQPQVMGACLDLIRQCSVTLRIEANAVTDNPLLFVESGEVLSGGNFHAEPVAFAADTLALALAEIGSLSERRMAVLVDPEDERPARLPGREQRRQFRLHDRAGDRRGLGVGEQDHRCALQRRLDSDLRESGRSRQHGDARARAGWRAWSTTRPPSIGIELLAAAQGIDFHRPSRSSAVLEAGSCEDPLRRAFLRR